MSNLDQEESDFNPVDFITSERRRTMGTAVGDLEADPEKAARAIQLSQATGVPAPVISGDQENFEQQHKTALTSSLLTNNEYLRSYIASNPMAGKVSNDDYGQLDAASQSIVKIGQRSVLGAAVEGFTKNYDYDSLAEEQQRLRDYTKDLPWAAKLPIEIGGAALGTSERLFSGVIGGVADAIGEAYTQLGGGEASARKLTRDLMVFAQVGLSGQGGFHAPLHPELAKLIDRVKPYLDAGKEPPVGIHPEIDNIKAEQAKTDGDSLKEALKESAASSTRERAPDLYADFAQQHVGNREIGISADAVRKLYGEKMPEPDDGVLGWVPDLQFKLDAAEASGLDVRVPLADWLAKVEPDVAKELHDFIRVRDGGVTIEEGKVLKVSAMAEQEEPTLTSRIKNIHNERTIAAESEIAKLEQEHDKLLDAASKGSDEAEAKAKQAGEPINSSSDLLKFMSPEAIAAHKRIREISNEIRKKSAEANYDRVLQILPEDFTAVRDIQKNDWGGAEWAQAIGTEDQHVIGIHNKEGSLVGNLSGFLHHEKWFEDFLKNPSQESVHERAMRAAEEASQNEGNVTDLSFEKQRPELQDIANKIDELTSRAPGQGIVQSIRRSSGTDRTLADLYGAEPLPYTEDVTAMVKPKELYTTHELEIEQAVKEELDRIAPRELESQSANRIEHGDESVAGVHIMYDKRLPIILYSLAAVDPIGIARHEAIHHLRGQGFFSGDEWATLAYAAIEQGWIKKYNINERYSKLSSVGKVEEAVAEAFKEWRRAGDKGVPTAERAIFRKLEMYVRAIQRAFKKAFGKEGEPTWQELFDRADEGEIGSREGTKPIVEGAKASAQTLEDRMNKLDQEKATSTQYNATSDINDLYSRAMDAAVGIGQPIKANVEHLVKWAVDNGRTDIAEAIVQRAERNATEDAARKPGVDKDIDPVRYAEVEKSMQEKAAGRAEEAKQLREMIPEKRAKPIQGELDVTRMEDKAVFDKAAAIGMTVDQYRRYMNLIESRRIEDMEADLKRATKAEEKRQSKEWKENKAELRTEVAEQMAQRPDIQALRFVEDKKINLTPETANSLAEYFGYQTGAEMIERVKGLQEQRKASGLNSYEFTRRLIDVETDRRMEQRYGDLGENILKEAKDQVLSETQLDLLHEETLALAEQAKVQLPIPAKELRAQIVEGIQGMELRSLTSDKLLEAAGRAGRETEMALLKGDAAEAFRQKQRQFIAVTMAKEAMKIEADVGRLDKLAKKYEGRDLPKIDPAAAAYTQQLLQQAGYKVKLMPQEIAREIEAHGHGTLGDYTQHLVDFGWEPNLSEEILSRGGKPLEQAKVSEFYELKDAADSLDFIGRNIMKIDLAGEKLDYKDWKAQTLEKIRSMPVRDISKAEAGGKEGNWLYRLDAPLTRMEEIVKDLDLREELGPLYKALIVPFELSKAKSYNMLNDLSKEFKGINGFNKKWRRSLEDNIPNDFIHDTYNETLFKLNRWNMVKMMLNWGNESNALKMVDGIARAAGEAKPSKEVLNHIHNRLEDMFAQHASPEDWNFVKKIWSVFDNYKGEVETMNRNLGGKIPKWVEGREIQTAEGPIKGGYFPLIPDRNRNLGVIPEGKKLTGTGPLGQDYFRATTNQKYLEQRTGARYFVDITNGPEQLIGRLQQVIHDISYRDFVKTAGQVIYDPEIKAAIRKHYGPEYAGQMEPWLKRIANSVTTDEKQLQGFNDILGKARLNLVAAALPLNYTVMLSPSMGTLNLKQLASFNADRTANKKVVMENSKEIQHMLYSLDRDVNQALRTQLGKQGWTAFQLKAMETMFKPLLWAEQEFRMTTFYGEYMKQKGEGRTDFEAGVIADSLIRERHGSQHVGDLPALMASSNEFVKMSTVFMGYFSTQRNWMRQIPERVRAGEAADVGKILWGTMGVATIMNAALFTKQKEQEGFFHWISRAVLSTPLQMIPFVRDIWNYATEGYQPTSPIMGLMSTTYEAIKDGVKLAKKETPKNPVKHAFGVAGTVAGVPGSMQMGRTAEFLKDVATREQRPRDIVEWMRGITTGEAKKRK